ncbi:MAG: hypothetical protein QF879_12595 [Candidatus Latescibacteria bacterium]|jgi:hypothetical protein|nr:hypothetical protein [Candidatus Latescibacterota bacterium]
MSISQSIILNSLCVLSVLFFTRPTTAQTAGPEYSAVIKGYADTPDHLLTHQSEAAPPVRKIMRGEPANALEIISKGLESVKAFGFWLGRAPLFIGNGSQGGGSGLGVAVGLKGQVGRITPLAVRLSYAITYRTYQTLSLQLIQTITPRAFVDGWGQYRYRPRENFFGIGARSLKTAESQYKQKNYNAGIGLGYRGDGYAVRGLVDWTDYKVGHGTNSGIPFTLSTFPDLIGAGAIRLVSTGIDFSAPLLLHRKPGWDTVIEMAFRAYFDVEGSTYGFNTYLLTLYQTLSVFRGNSMAVRATGLIADRRPGKAIPFFLLSRLGSSSTLRGFDNQRFHDTKAFVINGEYRHPLWHIGNNHGVNEGLTVDIVLFMDTGMVFDSFNNDVKSDNLSTNYGVGIRFHRKDGVMGRGMIAHSSESTNILVTIGRDF